MNALSFTSIIMTKKIEQFIKVLTVLDVMTINLTIDILGF